MHGQKNIKLVIRCVVVANYNYALLSFWMLRSVDWSLVTDVSGQHFHSLPQGSRSPGRMDCLTIEDENG